MNNLQRPRRFRTQGHDLIIRQRGVAAVDVADDVGIGGQHDVFVDQARAWNRRPAGVNRALNPELPAHATI